MAVEWCDNHCMMDGQQPVSNFEPPKKRPVMRTPDGRELPAGRQPGSQNKVTKTIREAVEKAATLCHPGGLAGWLVDRANGNVQDRQIFAGLVAKVIPLQVQAHVDGGIKLELSWLGSRGVGATTAQIEGNQTQVIEMQADSDGVLRIKDPAPPTTADTAAVPAAQKAAGGAGT